MTIGKNIKRCRTGLGLTQDQLAERLYVTRQTVSSWERGASQPSVQQLEAIAEALETDPMTLLYGPRPRYRPCRRQVAVTVLLGLVAAALMVLAAALRPEALYLWRRGVSGPLWGLVLACEPLGALLAGGFAVSLAGLFGLRPLAPKGRQRCLGAAAVLLGALLCLAPFLPLKLHVPHELFVFLVYFWLEYPLGKLLLAFAAGAGLGLALRRERSTP